MNTVRMTVNIINLLSENINMLLREHLAGDAINKDFGFRGAP